MNSTLQTLEVMKYKAENEIFNCEITVVRAQSLLDRRRPRYWAKMARRGLTSKKQNRLFRNLSRAEQTLLSSKSFLTQVLENITKAANAVVDTLDSAITEVVKKAGGFLGVGKKTTRKPKEA